jgi:hypothetical protein
MARGRYAVVAGGGSTTASDSNSAGGDYSTVSGGRSNYARLTHTTVSGGFDNYAFDDYSVVGGGRGNDAHGYSTTVSGGDGNTAMGFYGTIGGGQDNGAGTISAHYYTTIGGGENNAVSASCGTIAGGCASRADGEYSTIGGGSNNIASGIASTVPGGIDNHAEGDYTVAMGRQAQAVHDGSFVWADGSGNDYTTTADNQFLIRANGGVGIGTNIPQEQLDVAGNVKCSSLQEVSDARLKTDIRPISDALDKVGQLQGVSFNWNQEAESVGATPGDHQIGLVAQEVEQVIPELVSTPENGYKSVDYTKLTAVLVEAVKELKTDNDNLRLENTSLREDVQSLKTDMEALKAVLGK